MLLVQLLRMDPTFCLPAGDTFINRHVVSWVFKTTLKVNGNCIRTQVALEIQMTIMNSRRTLIKAQPGRGRKGEPAVKL